MASRPTLGPEAEALEIAVRALRWYADEKHWKEDDWGVPSIVVPPEYGHAGNKARNALRKVRRKLDHGERDG